MHRNYYYKQLLEEYRIKEGFGDYIKGRKGPGRIIKSVKRGIEREREIKRSNMSPEQKKKAWYAHLRATCREDAEAKNWSKEKLQKCYQMSKKSAGL